MRTSGGSRSILPLIEIVLAAAILTASCVIALYMFLISRYTGLLARDITEASIRAQSVTERLKSSDTPEELEQMLAELFDGGRDGGRDGVDDGERYIIRYDGEWNKVKTDGEYTLSLVLGREERERGVLYYIDVSVRRDNAYPFLAGEEKQQLADFHNARYMSSMK